MSDTTTTRAAVLVCGHAAQPTYYTAGTVVSVGTSRITMTGTEPMFPGYAILPSGVRVCPPCADVLQRVEMAESDRFTAYTSTDGRAVASWTGGELARVVSRTDNGRQTYLRAVTPDGSVWRGQGPSGTGMYVSLRRVSAGAR